MKKYFEYVFNEEIKCKLLEYYDSIEGMDDFDDGNKKTALKIDRISKYIHFNSNDLICDVGCADGVLLNYLQGKYKKGIGLDISKKVIEEDKRLNMPNVEFQIYDGCHIPYDEKFDKVFLMDVLEHSFEPDVLMKTIYCAIRKGGCLVMQVPTTGWLSELIFGKYHYGHLRYYDEEYLKKYLEKFGFKIVHIETFNSVPWSQKIINCSRLFRVMNCLCAAIPHLWYPYYGSVAAIAEK